jgi:hypothetical protein
MYTDDDMQRYRLVLTLEAAPFIVGMSWVKECACEEKL